MRKNLLEINNNIFIKTGKNLKITNTIEISKKIGVKNKKGSIIYSPFTSILKKSLDLNSKNILNEIITIKRSI